MSKIKKLIALTLALAMVLSVSAFAGSYKADTYADAAKIDADCESAVELLYALDIMVGDGKNFNPESAVTRAEMAKMIYVILNYGKDDKAFTYTGAKFFTDVEAGYWAEGYINYCASTKLIAGRGDGTFGPTDAVTTAEAAKMLLTAIGYNAEHRGYTGANWDKNVLADAAILGLLDGYKANVNLPAPRQWVAVMIENALECYTFGTMVPSFSGLLTSGKEMDYETMGEKYYGINVITAYAMATTKTSLYTDGTFAEKDCVLFSNSDGQYNIKKTGLKAADLGQEYKIILVDGAVASVRNTGKSVVAEAELRDIEAKTSTATSSNTENNKYVFTVGEFSGKLESAPAYIVMGQNGTTKVSAKALNPNTLYGQANGKTGNVPTTIKVIDKDADGLIDYAVYTEFYYADVTTVATSRAYGDYIKMEDNKGANIKYNGDSKLYVDDVIDCADALEEGNYVKYNWDHENAEYDIEVLEVIEDTLDRVTTAKQIVKIGGVEYVASEDTTAYGGYDLLVKANITKKLVAVVDGDMLVYVTTPNAKATLDGINAKLCVVTDKTDHYYTGWDKVKAVEIVTVEGTFEYVLADQTVALEDINVVTKYADLVKRAGGEGKYLYVFSINDDNEIALTPVAASAAGLTALDKNADVIDGYWVGTATAWEVSDEFFGDEIVLANTYFVLENKTLSIKTLEEVEGKTADAMYWEGLYDCSSKLHSMVAGFIAVDSFSVYDDGAYLYLTDDVYSNDKTNYKADVVFANGDADTIILNHTEAEAKAFEMYTLYKYTVKNDKYTLTKVEADQADVTVTKTASDRYIVAEEGSAYELVEKFTGNEIYVDTGADKLSRYDLTDCVIAIKNTTFDLDRQEDDVIEVSYELEFITLDELKAMDTIFNSFEENDDWYFSDFKYVAEDLFYVEVYRVTEECQEIAAVAPEYPVVDDAEVAIVEDVIYTNLTGMDAAVAVEAALIEAGYTDITGLSNTGLGEIKAKKGSIEVTFTVAQIALNNPGAGNCYVAPFLTNETKAGINVGLVFNSNIDIAAKELTVALYAGETAIAEATNVNAIAANGATSFSFYGHDHDSSSWDGNNFTAETAKVPTGVKVFVNGVEFDEMSVTIAAADWAAYVAKCATGCGCAECQ